VPTERAVLAAIVGMALVTYATRAGGLWLMSRVPLNARAASFLRHLSGCVLVALVVPAVARGDFATVCGVVAALAAMLGTRRAPLAMLCGVVTAAVVRAI